jgi:hypothetical protein
MGHFVTGLIAKSETLDSFAQRHSLHAPIALCEGLAILPLRDEDIDSFIKPPLTGHSPGFIYLSEQLRSELAAASAGAYLMYFETEYFGGNGVQGAAVFHNGLLAFGPKSAQSGPINDALALLGVMTKPPAPDEFEHAGLHRHRHTEDWLESDAHEDEAVVPQRG